MQEVAEHTDTLHNLPDEMKNLKRWLLWKAETRYNKAGDPQSDSQGNIKVDKVPYQLNGKYKASKTNPSHFETFQEAYRAYQSGSFSGIGFVLVENDPYVIIDIDDCFRDGQLADKAKKIVDPVDSYTELSQSGNGLHIVVKGDNVEGFNNRDEQVEMYSKEWFFAMTGDVFQDLITIEDRKEIVSYLHDNYSPKNKEKPLQQVEDKPEMLTDNELITKIRSSKQCNKFSTLHDKGDISSYPSDSEADYGLANILAWWTKNSLQIERIMRNSALCRVKWDGHPDYLQERTIQGALKKNEGVGFKMGSDFQLNVDNEVKTVIIPEPFQVLGGSLYQVKKAKSENETDQNVFVSRHVPYLTKEFHNIENAKTFYEVIWNQRGRQIKEIVPASAIATKNQLLELSDKGFSVNDNNAKRIISFLDFYQADNEINQHLAVERLGKIKGEYIHPVLTDGIEIMAIDQGEKQLLESFEVNGTADSWKTEVFERIKDQPKAVFMVLTSFASVIIEDLGIKPFIVELSGDTSQGKTTVLEISSTVHGNKHLMNEWNATPVVIERKAAYLNNYPLLMDDTRKGNKWTLSNIVYQFSGGRSKGRGSVKGSQKEYTWNNILLSTGEVSLNDYAKTHGGAAARIIPLGDEPLKRDYEMIVDLQGAMTENYGAIGVDFLRKWMEHEETYIPDFSRIKKNYVKKAGTNSVLSRLAEFYAAVHFTGEFLKDHLNMDIDLSAIVPLFDEIAEENKDVDKPMKFLEDILTDLDSKRSNISDGFVGEDPLKAIYDSDIDQLYLLPAYTKELLGVEENQTRKSWLKRGITVSVEKNEKKLDYKTVRHHTTTSRVIPLNMDCVKKLGFDFK